MDELRYATTVDICDCGDPKCIYSKQHRPRPLTWYEITEARRAALQAMMDDRAREQKRRDRAVARMFGPKAWRVA